MHALCTYVRIYIYITSESTGYYVYSSRRQLGKTSGGRWRAVMLAKHGVRARRRAGCVGVTWGWCEGQLWWGGAGGRIDAACSVIDSQLRRRIPGVKPSTSSTRALTHTHLHTSARACCALSRPLLLTTAAAAVAARWSAEGTPGRAAGKGRRVRGANAKSPVGGLIDSSRAWRVHCTTVPRRTRSH